MPLDTAAVRVHFPALAEGAAHFDGPGGTLVAAGVADAVAQCLRSAVANRGRINPAARRADDIVLAARQAIADLTGGRRDGVVFGRSMTALTYDVARALAKDWAPGDEVVVSRLDHDANIRPWVAAARSVGATVRWAEFDPQTGELAPDAFAQVIGARTRLVAVTGASNLIGTRPDVAAITALARDVGATTYVDGVHLTAHAPIDVDALGADLFACSPYKFCGPHLGAVVGRAHVLDRLQPDKLLPSTDQVPERFELGTLPYELLAGTTAAVDFLAGLTGSVEPDRRTRLRESLAALEASEDALRQDVERGLSAIDGLTLWSRAQHRTPTLLFSVEGLASADISAQLADHGVYAPAGSFYAWEAAHQLGLGEAGAVRAGLSPYTDGADVERLVDGVRRAVSALRR